MSINLLSPHETFSSGFLRVSFFFLLLIFLFFGSIAQQKDTLERTIKILERSVTEAIVKGDTNSLKDLWDVSFMVNTPRNDIAVNRSAVLAHQQAGLINYSSFERVVEKILVKDNVVITMGSETFISRNDIPGAKSGEPVKRRFTNIWLNQNGKWTQVARHASIVCIQTP